MILYILRHGIAEDAPVDGDDGARKLTPKGREKIHAAAECIFSRPLSVSLRAPSSPPTGASSAIP